jgi:hypothetical protein
MVDVHGMMAKISPTIPSVLPGSAAGCGVAWYSAMGVSSFSSVELADVPLSEGERIATAVRSVRKIRPQAGPKHAYLEPVKA